MIIDGHGHACGNYLTNEGITSYLLQNKVDYVVLVPGMKGSKMTYSFNEKAYDPDIEILDKTNKLVRFGTGLTHAVNHIPHGNQKIK